VLAAVLEAVIGNQLAAADIRDSDLPDQTITARRALAELNRIRVHHLDAGDHRVQVITRRNPLQASISAAFQIDTSTCDNAHVTGTVTAVGLDETLCKREGRYGRW
jgi:hypothetical protein